MIISTEYFRFMSLAIDETYGGTPQNRIFSEKQKKKYLIDWLSSKLFHLLVQLEIGSQGTSF